jgi:integrase
MSTVPVVCTGIDASWLKLKSLVLDSVSASNSKRLYGAALDAFYKWYFAEPRPAFGKAVVHQYRALLERHGYAPSTIGIHLAAIRKLALEASDNGLLDTNIAAAVCRVRGPRRLGRRVGNWLNGNQAADLIKAPPEETRKGSRDRAILAVAVGCGLRRSEIAALNLSHLQLRGDRWIIADLVGKHRRTRSVPIPTWVKERLDPWLAQAAMETGRVFRSINKADVIIGDRMSSQAVYEVIKTYGSRLSLAIAPHDLRRTFAKLAYASDRRIEQIQYSLGHSSASTTAIYLGLQQDLANSPGDHIVLPL